MSETDEKYKEALSGKKVPIVTLDHKWHGLFARLPKTDTIIRNEEHLNELLRKQGKCNTETKNIKKLKKKMMDEIMTLMEEDDSESEKKIEENKRLINDCNDKIDAYQEELLDLPKEINDVNYALMVETMDICYRALHENTKDIEEISEWIKDIRIELKKKVVRKQEMEIVNQEVYAYMHDIFGVDVINIFDMKYNPLDNPITAKKENKE